MIFFRPPPPGTHLRPWIPDLIFIPISRAFERLGVYFYNRVIANTEIGLYHKFYNPRVHGPYCHFRWYGKPDTKLLDVKLSELPAWFGRREKTIGAFYNELMRNIWLIHWKWQGAVFTSPIDFVFKLVFFVCFLNWCYRFRDYFIFRKTPYHW